MCKRSDCDGGGGYIARDACWIMKNCADYLAVYFLVSGKSPDAAHRFERVYICASERQVNRPGQGAGQVRFLTGCAVHRGNTCYHSSRAPVHSLSFIAMIGACVVARVTSVRAAESSGRCKEIVAKRLAAVVHGEL